MAEVPSALAAWDAARGASPGEPFCHAPYVNLHFSHGGTALACCHNRTYALGQYPDDSVSAMWHGAQAQRLREAVAGHDLSRGCQPCARQLAAGDLVGLSDMAGSYTSAASQALWQRVRGDAAGLDAFSRLPLKLEFEVHNSCNLECVMCHGAASSSIRKHRDGLAPLPTPYDTAFVDQLSPFLDGISEAAFTGGEPFLIPFYYTLWDRIADVNPGMDLAIVTNGTVLNDRVRRVVEDLNAIVNVSVDSIVPGTYEAIRKGASLAQVIDNSRYFADVMARKGRGFFWRCCVMRQNCREMPDMVRFCNDHGIRVIFNQVEFPLRYSLHTLSHAELRAEVDVLRTASFPDASTPVHHFNQQQYQGLVRRLEGFLEPETWQHGLADRLENARANPMLHGWSTQGLGLVADRSADAFADQVSRYVAMRVTIDQAVQSAGSGVVPPDAWTTVSELRGAIDRFRETLPPDVFLRVFLHVALRTVVKIAGVTPADGLHVFDRIEPAVRQMTAAPDSAAIADAVVTLAPAALHALFLREGPLAIDALRPPH